MWFFTCFICSLSKSSGCSFPCVIITHLIRKGWISKSHHCYFGKYCMWFSTLCHSLLSNSSGCNFPCVATTHLISRGWISIFCHCYFTKQLMWLPTFCNCCLCCHWTFRRQCLWFSTCCTYLILRSSHACLHIGRQLFSIRLCQPLPGLCFPNSYLHYWDLFWRFFSRWFLVFLFFFSPGEVAIS